MKRDITLTHEIGRALLAQYNANPVTCELATLRDKKYPQDIPTKEALEIIRHDYVKVSCLTWVIAEPVQLICMAGILFTGMLLMVALIKQHVSFNQIMFFICLVGLMFLIPQQIERCFLKKINLYRDLGEQVEYLRQMDYSVITSPLDIVHEIERLCVLIVQCEVAGMSDLDEINFVNVRGDKVKMQLHELRYQFRHQVSFAAKTFGLVSPDLNIHFKRAKDHYERGLACGHYMTDFQI